MKKFLPFILVLASCAGETNPVDEIKSPDVDTLSQVIDSVVEVAQLEPLSRIDSLINNPLDLVAFKKEWGGSNSSGVGGQKYFDTPDTVGMMYKYMLFWKLRNVLPSHPNEGDLFHKFRITVYKFGEEAGDFFDTNEELMMIECALDNPKIGELNWFGKTKVGVMDIYGVPTYEKNDCIIYESENGVISAHLADGNIDWFKYAKLNKELDLSNEIPLFLLEF